MNIGARLRQLREARHFSQGDVEERTGLLRCYISRVECGHTVPAIETLEKIARALDLELYQLFYAEKGKPSVPRVRPPERLERRERNLVDMYRRMPSADQKLLSGLARFAAQKRRHV
jgi:transcriptional regulator with XRE-family HTH domain